MDIDQLLSRARGITCDSRQVGPGYIFVAIRGSQTDGNRYAAAAAHRGAAAVVSDRPDTLPTLGIPVVGVSDARQALAEIASRFHNHPSRALSLVGVTGTNGKTTVACMLEHIFQTAGLVAGLIGTGRVNTGKASFASTLTTPDAASLQGYLAAMRDNAVTHAAMEVTAQGLYLKRVENVCFTCGVITNITPDHLDFPGGFPGYLAAKQSFPALLPPGAPLIANSADALCREAAARAPGPVITAALDAPADVVARLSRLSSRGSEFSLTLSRPLPGADWQWRAPVTLAAKISLPGRHNVENALLAAAAALTQGIAPAAVARALASFPGVPRRLEVIRLGNVTVLDDTALNPGSIDAVFRTIASFRCRRLAVAFAIRGGRGPEINAANACALSRWWHEAPFPFVVTAGTGCVGPGDTATAAEKSAFCEALDKAGVVFSYHEPLADAVETAYAAANPGGLLALLGAQGMDDGFRLLARQAPRLTAASATAAVPC